MAADAVAAARAAQRERLVHAMRHRRSRVLEDRDEKAIALRAHRPGDIGWVVRRHGALYDDEYGWGARFEALVAGIVARFLQQFDARRERCWIAEMRRRARRLGVRGQRHRQRVAKLRLLLVEPRARGLGLGKRLVSECIALRAAPATASSCCGRSRNLAAARAIYTALGFAAGQERSRTASFGVR